VKKMLYEKIKTIDIAYFDTPSYYDDAALVLQDATERIMRALNTVSSFISHAFCVGVLITFFTQVDWVIVVIALVPLVLSLIFAPMTNKMKYKYNIANVPDNRKFEYVKRTIIQNEYAKELRITNIKNVLIQFLASAVENTKALLKKHYIKITGIETVNVFFGFAVVCFAATLVSIYRILVTGSIGTAMFIPLWGALAGFGWRAGSVVETYSQLLEDRLYIDKIIEFINNEPAIYLKSGALINDKLKSLVIENVNFRYTENDECVLKNINMEIKAGEKIAVVGYNGAGKSTLINLILRLYDPSGGVILYNGKDIRELNIYN
jgi:ATP-binding cassette subfamily B protein